MAPDPIDDEPLTIASRIADGSDIHWPDEASAETSAGLYAALRTIAALATLHRAPDETGPDARPAEARWGPLVLSDVVATGAFGTVYRAWEPRLQRQVALKLLAGPASIEAALPMYAIEEARLLARIRHPNVLTVHGAECLDGRVGIWTEFIDGQTLETIVRERGRLPADEVAAIGIDLCRALSAVHAAGLLHRDIKAQNVMRETGGRIVLMDFGTGHDLLRVPVRPGDLSGTPLYLAPEIFSGQAPSVASDIYALAVLLHFVATRRFPVSGATLGDVGAAHQERTDQRLNEGGVELPAAFRKALERGLARDPEHRFATSSAFEAALASARTRQTSKRARSTMLFWSSIAALLLVGVVGALLVIYRGRGGESILMKITMPHYAGTGQASHDGKFVPFITADGDLLTWEFSTGHTSVVATGFRANKVMVVVNPLMSPDGDRVAYTEPRLGGYDLTIRNRDGTLPRTLLTRESEPPRAMDWSRDGRTVLCLLRRADGKADLALIPAEGGQAKWVYTGEEASDTRNEAMAASLSPDGRFIVTHRATSASPNSPGDFVLIEIAHPDRPPTVLFKGEADDRLPMWMPDGRRVFFLRPTAAKSNDTDGWILSVVDGVPRGEPVLVMHKLGALRDSRDMSITDRGDLYRPWSWIFGEGLVAGFNADGPSAVHDATRLLERDLQGHFSPRWSPDGTSIAYLSIVPPQPHFAPTRSLTVMNVATRTTRNVASTLTFFAGFRPTWTTDSASLLVPGWDRSHVGHVGLYLVSVATGATTLLVQPPNENPSDVVLPECLPNGREFVYADHQRGLVVRDLHTGAEHVFDPQHPVFAEENFVFNRAGDAVAFVRTVDHISAIFVQHAGEPAHRLQSFERGSAPVVQAWLRSTDELVYAVERVDGSRALWRIAATGGTPQDMHVAIDPSTSTISLSPDEHQVAYAQRTVLSQLWITTAGWDRPTSR